MTIYRGVGGSGDSATGEDVFGDNSSITSLNGISGAIQTPTYIKFASGANHTANQGELTWNTAEGTLDLGLNHGGVVLQIGQELHYRVTNQSGITIDNGTLVAFAGTTGNSGKLLVEAYDGSQPSRYILGIATEEILNGANGYVTCFGKVRGIQTNGGNYGETWVDGDEIYPSASGLTNVLPQAPNPKQAIAAVVNAHGSNGELFVRVQGHTSLADDELVQLTSLTNGDILQYNGTNGRFENVPANFATSAQGALATTAQQRSYAALANGTTAMGLATNNVVKVTPTASATYTTTVPSAGTRCSIIILTSGSSSYTITFGTGFKTTGTLSTGVTTSRNFVIDFISDGTNLLETGRTTAYAA